MSLIKKKETKTHDKFKDTEPQCGNAKSKDRNVKLKPLFPPPKPKVKVLKKSAVNETKTNKFDEGLYNRLTELLSKSGFIKFIKEQDFNESFLYDYLKPLNEFVITWDNTEYEFMNSNLEEQRIKLLKSAKLLSATVLNKTSWINENVQSAKPRHLLSHPMPDWVSKDAEEINQVADDFVKMFEEFIKFAKSKLYS